MIRAHKYIIHFIVLVLLQVLILNNIQISSYFNPFIYILFILILPLDINKSLLLLLGFILGITIDIFSDTMGLHAGACVFLAYIRPHILNSISTKEDYEPGTIPGININGFLWFLKYIIITTVAHHLFLFLVEIFSFNDFPDTLLKVISSSLFSVFTIIFYYILAIKKS